MAVKICDLGAIMVSRRMKIQYKISANINVVQHSNITLSNGNLETGADTISLLKQHAAIVTRAVCKVRGLTLLLSVGTLWRCGDGLFFEVPPLASDAFLTTLHPLLQNVLQTVDHFEISCLGDKKSHGARSELNSVFRLEKVDRWNPIRTSAIQSRSRPMRFLSYSDHEKGASR
jgi:hypothetical protein